jgi:hypothetical protein
LPDARSNGHGTRAAPRSTGFGDCLRTRRRSLQATGLCRERACSPVARSHRHVASGAALPRPEVPGRTCLVWTPGCPLTRPKANGTARHRCDPSSPNSGRRLARSSHRHRQTSHARPARCRTQRSAWAGHRDILGSCPHSSIFRISLRGRSHHVVRPSHPATTRRDSHHRGVLPGEPAQKHDPGASMPQSGRRTGTATNAQAMATSHNLRSHEIAPRLSPRLHSVLTGRWSPSSTSLLPGATS